MKIPQYDLDGLGGEFTKTRELEQAIAGFLGVRHVVMTSSGTAAIFLALRATGARTVAVPALTMFGTAAAAELAGCQLRIVSNNEIPDDVDTYVHVSLNGRDCGITEVLKKHPSVTIIEDACQSFGSRYAGRYLGTFGAAGCFSFSPHKILSAGNGGCVVTNDQGIAERVRALKNFGRLEGGGDVHDSPGYNFKFTDIQAEFVLRQFPELHARIERKKNIYKQYYRALRAIMLPHEGTPWFVDVYVEERDRLAASLREKGIQTRPMYPLLNNQRPLSDVPVYGAASEDSRRSAHGLWLPSSLTLTEDQIAYVIEAVQERI